MRAQGSDELYVEGFEVALGSLQERLCKALGVGGAHAEFRKLETEEVQVMKDARENGDGSDVDRGSRDDGGDQAVSRRIIFDQGSAGGEGGLYFFEREIGGRFERSVFAFVSGQLAKGA